MPFISAEIALQPAAWQQAAQLLPGVAQMLPADGERVAVVGCGTSWFMAESYARLREEARLGETDAFSASEFPAHRHYDRVVAITRSGTTTEILTLLARLRGVTPTVALTADTATPVVEVTDLVIDLSFANERSVVQTLFATTALTLLRAHLRHDIGHLITEAESVLAAPLDSRWVEAEQVTFLGSGWAHGIAKEAALKMREACQAWTESYPSTEYRHGPISIAAPGRLVWQFGTGEPGLAEQVDHTGATYVHHQDDPQVDLLRIQLLAAARATRLGLDPDHPRNLSRSVILDG